LPVSLYFAFEGILVLSKSVLQRLLPVENV
jgi:hypothetical protein